MQHTGQCSMRLFVGEERTQGAEQIYDIRAGVAFDVLNVVSVTAAACCFSIGASVLVSSRA